jgi:hypothetical protein
VRACQHGKRESRRAHLSVRASWLASPVDTNTLRIAIEPRGPRSCIPPTKYCAHRRRGASGRSWRLRLPRQLNRRPCEGTCQPNLHPAGSDQLDCRTTAKSHPAPAPLPHSLASQPVRPSLLPWRFHASSRQICSEVSDTCAARTALAPAAAAVGAAPACGGRFSAPSRGGAAGAAAAAEAAAPDDAALALAHAAWSEGGGRFIWRILSSTVPRRPNLIT